MGDWVFTLPHVDEGLMQWDYDPLLRRLKLAQGISIIEAPQGSFTALRFPTQDQIADAYFFYQGGHEYLVNDVDRAALIAGNVGVTAANFVPVGGAVAVTSVNGYMGPAVILGYADVGAARPLVLRKAYVTTGNITLPNVGSTWTPVAGLELDIPAAVGDYVELSPSFMYQPATSTFLDLAVLVGGSLVRFSSTGTGTSAAANEGDPSLYAAPGTYRTSGTTFGFTVASGDLDGSNVRFVMANFGVGSASVIYASSNYPFRWVAKNYGPVT